MSRKFFVAVAAILLAATLSVGDAYARAGGGGSFGSRGSRSFSMPSATPTAPSASPLNRGPGASTLNPGLQRPGFNRPGFFGGGFGRGFIGGLLGAGLLGLLFGHGLFGGLGGIFSLLGLFLQIALIVLLVRLAIGFFRNRQQPAYAGAPYGGAPGGDYGASYRSASAPLAGSPPPATTPLNIDKADYDVFESRLAAIQNTYGQGDLDSLRHMVTPEMADEFAQEIAANNRRGVVDKVSGARLIQGDLSEAWQEPGAEYATVAMRYSVLNPIVDQATGRVVSGSATVPEEVTEVWTFQRRPGGSAQDWQLSAIQQTH
ncbi:MAG: TIM44-like domain-containing protein [Methylobacteriaceae bacterium]|nr:TIM44-like domain-containing protein [Methylobacteriaceae bacterium]